MNISTERIWCYTCEKEVHIQAALQHQRGQTPDSTSITPPASKYGFERNMDNDDDDDGLDYGDDPEAQPRGLIGLQNLGNTCYMNAALQALSHTQPLTEYFIDCSSVVSILAGDKKPGLSRAYQKLIKELWNRKTRGYVVPNNILYGIRNVHPMFRGYHQHDTQEFLRCFMDQLHEELKEPVCAAGCEDKLNSEADGDHQEPRSVHIRRRAASSGASDTTYFNRIRRKSPAPSVRSESRPDGYLRIHNNLDNGPQNGPNCHRRSASFAGTQHSYVTHVPLYG
ncbi:Ubiquitin carboxyl-terminal hydrolase 20 [Eumeta japonica]|uniref:ubiquitinyl hydrolase 1 n=1 Tax=Eumeta variegata TaxID=151549 RepID=A0A4C1W7P5_EUMVA|nr:Ubiquitin carboxyl-terminal hydrolase 20 [Eumeta japonica]